MNGDAASTTLTPSGTCGARARAASCALRAGHLGPHQAGPEQNQGGRPDEWLDAVPAQQPADAPAQVLAVAS